MEHERFENLTIRLRQVGSRRRLFGVIATIPVLGALFGEQDTEHSLARKRRHTRRTHRPVAAEGKKKKKKKCKPKGTATVCAGTCGPTRNKLTCNKTVDCGPCTCAPACNVCQKCDATTRTCVADPARNGQACGSGNQQCCGGSCSTGSLQNQTTFGNSGTGPTQFSGPFGMAVSADELTMWVADRLLSRVSVWSRSTATSPNWNHQVNLGSAGSDADQFFEPRGVAVSEDGLTLLVADTENDRVSVWTRATATTASWSHQVNLGASSDGPDWIGSPQDVAVSPDGLTAWVVDGSYARVSTWTRPDANSTAWSHQVNFGSSGSGADQFQVPFGVAVSADTLTVWVVENGFGRVSVWTRPNASSSTWSHQVKFGSPGQGVDQLSSPRYVTASQDQLAVWVADSANHRISRWTRPSTNSTNWSHQDNFGAFGEGVNQFKSPQGVAVSADAQTTWVVDFGNARVSVLGLTCPA